jgi:hypothetical protein
MSGTELAALIFGFVGLCGLAGGISVAFGSRNKALSSEQTNALTAAQTQIAALQADRDLKAEKIRSLEQVVGQLNSRVDAAERMATSKDLIIDIARYQQVPEEVIGKYRKGA